MGCTTLLQGDGMALERHDLLVKEVGLPRLQEDFGAAQQEIRNAQDFQDALGTDGTRFHLVVGERDL
jgi:hypothetical protein